MNRRFQVAHWMKVVSDWKQMLGQDWEKTYALSNTLYVTRQNNILFTILAQFFGKEAMNTWLFLFETPDFTTTADQMLDLLTRIVIDRSVGEVFFGNYYLMDYELMGTDARRSIEAEDKKRGLNVFLPPLVPFLSHEWPFRIDPSQGDGPRASNRACTPPGPGGLVSARHGMPRKRPSTDEGRSVACEGRTQALHEYLRGTAVYASLKQGTNQRKKSRCHNNIHIWRNVLHQRELFI